MVRLMRENKERYCMPIVARIIFEEEDASSMALKMSEEDAKLDQDKRTKLFG